MPNSVKLKLIIRVLEGKGFFFVSQNGSHSKYRKVGDPVLTVIVPIHGGEVAYGTFRSIVRQAKLRTEDFEE